MKTSEINFNLYKTFVAVYETKSMSEAANRLGITQPTISHNTKELEKQLNVRLFITHPRGVDPTPNADILYRFVNAGFISLLNAEDAIKQFSETSQGVIKLNLSRCFANQMISGYIAEFNKKYPNILFEISEMKKSEALDSLAKRTIDIMIMSALPNSKNLTLQTFDLNFIASKEFVKQHNLGASIKAEQLRKLPVITFDKSYGVRTEIDKLCGNYIAEVASSELLLDLVAQGIGIGYCVESTRINHDNIVKLNVGVTTPKIVLCYNHNSDLENKAALAFIAGLKQHFGVK